MEYNRQRKKFLYLFPPSIHLKEKRAKGTGNVYKLMASLSQRFS